MRYVEKSLFGTIEHGNTGITFTDDFITNDSIIDVYFEDDDINPIETTQSGNTVTVTIEETTTDVDVCIHITNEDTIDYSTELETINDILTNHNSVLTSHGTEIIDLRGDVDNIDTTLEDHDERITECFTSVSNGKKLLADAITDKGVSTSASDTFQTMATNISNIPSGGGSSIQVFSKNENRSIASGSNYFSFTVEQNGYLYLTIGIQGDGGYSTNYLRKNNTKVNVTVASSYYDIYQWYYFKKIPVSVGDVITYYRSNYTATVNYSVTAYINED